MVCENRELEGTQTVIEGRIRTQSELYKLRGGEKPQPKIPLKYVHCKRLHFSSRTTGGKLARKTEG